MDVDIWVMFSKCQTLDEVYSLADEVRKQGVAEDKIQDYINQFSYLPSGGGGESKRNLVSLCFTYKTKYL